MRRSRIANISTNRAPPGEPGAESARIGTLPPPIADWRRFYNPDRGDSSAGRAPHSHCGGREFESLSLHHSVRGGAHASLTVVLVAVQCLRGRVLAGVRTFGLWVHGDGRDFLCLPELQVTV